MKQESQIFIMYKKQGWFKKRKTVYLANIAPDGTISTTDDIGAAMVMHGTQQLYKVQDILLFSKWKTMKVDLSIRKMTKL